MLELRIVSGNATLPLFDLPAALGRSKAAKEIADTIEGLIAFVDELGGEPDLEAGGDDEEDGTHADLSWPEWHTRGRRKLTAVEAETVSHGPAGTIHEDDEDDDPSEEADDDSSVEDDPVGFDPEEDCGADWRHQAPDCDLTALHWHRDRIRAERCERVEAGQGLYREPFPRWRLRRRHV